MKLVKIDSTGKKLQLTVSDEIFGVKPNPSLLAQAVRVYFANAHLGRSKVKTRGEVKRTTKKWFKQKGTGNARHGARSAPIFVGGGVAHGPKVEQHLTLKLSQQLKRKSLIAALSLRAKDSIVSTQFAKLTGKTKDGQKIFEALKLTSNKILVVLTEVSELEERSLRNLSNAVVVEAQRLNAFDVLAADKLIFSPEALKNLEFRLVTNAK